MSLPEGGSIQGGVCTGVVVSASDPGGGVYQTPPCGQNSGHTLVKTLIRCGR